MIIDATFWVAISFFIFIGVLIYYKIPQKVNIVINEKINETKKELEEAEKLKDVAKNLLSDYENTLNQASNETVTIINSAKKESEKNLINSTEKFYQLMDNRKKILNQKIIQMKEDAIKEIKNTSISVMVQSVEKILKNSILSYKIINEAKKSLEKDFRPITDTRASEKYRMEVAKNLLEKCFLEIKQKKLIRINI